MMYAQFSFKWLISTIGVCALVALAALGAHRMIAHASGSSIDTQARAIVADCATKGGDHSACYESEVPNLYPQYDVPSIFSIVREIRTLDPSYQFCHVLGHKIGERVVAEDPSAWVNAIPLNPSDGLCSNGFIHGVVGGRFRAEVLNDETIQKFMPDFTIACTPHAGWQPSDLDRAICYHGMGHLFDFITNADIAKSLSLCRQVAPDSYERVCVQGVFMQIYQPLEPDDYALIAQMNVKPSTTTVQTYCALYRNDPMAEGSCIEESWPLQQPHITDGTAVGKLCSWEPNGDEADVCYMAMASIVGRMTLGTPDKTVAACAAFPTSRQATCYSYSAEAVLEENRTDASSAIALCGRASAEIASQCLSLLVSHAQFMFGPNQSQLQAFCSAMPEAYRVDCGNGPGIPVAPIVESDTIRR